MNEDIENVRGLPPPYFDGSTKEANESCNTLSDRAIGESENPVDLVDEENQKTGVGLKAACARNIHCSSWLCTLINITMIILLVYAITGLQVNRKTWTILFSIGLAFTLWRYLTEVVRSDSFKCLCNCCKKELIQ